MPEKADTKPLFEKLMILEYQLSSWLKAHLKRHDPTTDPEILNAPRSSTQHSTNLFNLTCESLCRISLLLAAESLNDLLETHPQLYYNHQTNTATLPSPEVCAANLCQTTTLLTRAAKTPINSARLASGPVYFLREFFTRKRDAAGLQWCAGLKKSVCDEGAPFLSWNALLPWCLLDLHQMFARD